jgi:hypothetical protein
VAYIEGTITSVYGDTLAALKVALMEIPTVTVAFVSVFPEKVAFWLPLILAGLPSALNWFWAMPFDDTMVTVTDIAH